MPDNKKIKRPLDSKRIDIHDPGEVAYWCGAFRCTSSELEEAVEVVGTSASKVCKWLRRQRCRSLGCTERELKAAIEAGCTSKSEVQQWLKENRATDQDERAFLGPRA